MKRTGTFNSNNGGAAKKPSRGGGYDEDGPSFEDELGMMDQMEFEVIEGVEGAESAESQEIRWTRPCKADSFNSKTDNLAFHWLDIDMVSGPPLAENPDGTNVLGSLEGPVPIIRMYGVTALGQSVMANVHGFTPYFYVSFPSSVDLNEATLGQLRATLDQRVNIKLCSNC